MAELNISQAATWLSQYHRLTNYIGAAQLYLTDNYRMAHPLQPEHIKQRILGHWGTVPGLNALYGAINWAITTHLAEAEYETLLVVGPGHGAPAITAGTWVEGSLEKYYPEYARNTLGLENLIHDFSWPNKLQSHVTPHVPGSIQEGGELGYSLGTAFGSVFDEPHRLTFCIVGDGEAETGALAASWHSSKFLNPHRDGVVLPILHLNGYKISGPTVMGTMSDEELLHYFTGLGYHPYIINQYESSDIYADLLSTLSDSLLYLQTMRETWNPQIKPLYPLLIFRSMKGWTGATELRGTKVEDTNLSHGIPLKNPKADAGELAVLQSWLESYQINDLLTEEGRPTDEILKFIPKIPHTLGCSLASNPSPAPIHLPSLLDFDHEDFSRGQKTGNELKLASEFLAQTVQYNPDTFRIFSPDESESNHLESVFKVTCRAYTWPIRGHDAHIKCDGRMLEILSEQVLQSWFQGYTLTGRYGIFISYEAFFAIISSQIDQYLKYLKSSAEVSWRNELPSMNYLATSTLWRQEHNGFTHQNPSLINSLLTKQTDRVQLYFPVGINSLLATFDEALKSRGKVNYITSGKRDFPQWMPLPEARERLEKGWSIWEWASDPDPDVVLFSIGDYQTLETMAAMQWLREHIPELKIRMVNALKITHKGFGNANSHEELESILTPDKPVIINFHGYPEVIKQLLYGYGIAKRTTILGYRENGATTTPFDMQVRNGTSRYHVARLAVSEAGKYNETIRVRISDIDSQIHKILLAHENTIRTTGDDLPEVVHWKWIE